MTYFEQLQEKYPDDIKKAYKEYILSKSIYRYFYVSEDTTLFTKEAMQMQENLNIYAQSIINNEGKSLADILGYKTTEQLFKFIEQKEELFDFLEIDRGNLISYITGMYEIQLNTSIPRDLQWSDLENIIKEENNNVAVLPNDVAIKKLELIAKTFGLSSVSYGKVRTTETSLNKLQNSLTQLQQVIECTPEQVGLKKYNIFLDVAEFTYAGEASEVKGQIKLYINERLSHDAFAHEWLHGIDILMARVKSTKFYMYSEAKKGSVHKLLEELNVGYVEDIQKIKSTVLEDTKQYMDKIVDRFDAMASVSNPQQLKEKLQEQISIIQTGNFNFESVKEIIDTYMKDKNGCSSYLLTELSMLDKFLKEEDKNFKNSYFYEYAKEMQNTLTKTGLMKKEYSTLREEMFARAFESFAQVTLEEKQLNNDIAHANVSAWTPKKVETVRQKQVWQEVLSEIKEIMEFYLPNAQKTNLQPDTAYIQNNIKQIRQNMLKKEEPTIAVKIK